MRFFLAIVIVLALAAFAACGGDSETTEQPSAATEPAPAVEPAPSTASPSTAVTPTEPAPTVDPAPSTAPPGTAVTSTDPAASIDPGVTISSGITLADGCTAGGILDDATTVIACNIQAMQQHESFSFDATVNLLAVFPVERRAGGSRGRPHYG